jgi:hypothetical protein
MARLARGAGIERGLLVLFFMNEAGVGSDDMCAVAEILVAAVQFRVGETVAPLRAIGGEGRGGGIEVRAQQDAADMR